jgi:prepilin-type N-terminal cleavage/methylation domain-containing protein
MKTTKYENGFTLIELLLALVITGIIASAVATLGYAMNSAGVATDDTSRKQAQVRFATLKISDLIRQCKLVCYASSVEIAIWTGDANGDKKINIGELAYIEAGSAHNHLQLYTFSGTAVIELGWIGALATNWWSTYGSRNLPTPLIPLTTPAQCKNVTFYLDSAPPNSKIVSITFDLLENRVTSKYQINAALRARAANLLGASGNIVSDDD